MVTMVMRRCPVTMWPLQYLRPMSVTPPYLSLAHITQRSDTGLPQMAEHREREPAERETDSFAEVLVGAVPRICCWQLSSSHVMWLFTDVFYIRVFRFLVQLLWESNVWLWCQLQVLLWHQTSQCWSGLKPFGMFWKNAVWSWADDDDDDGGYLLAADLRGTPESDPNHNLDPPDTDQHQRTRDHSSPQQWTVSQRLLA